MGASPVPAGLWGLNPELAGPSIPAGTRLVQERNGFLEGNEARFASSDGARPFGCNSLVPYFHLKTGHVERRGEVPLRSAKAMGEDDDDLPPAR